MYFYMYTVYVHVAVKSVISSPARGSGSSTLFHDCFCKVWDYMSSFMIVFARYGLSCVTSQCVTTVVSLT